MNNIPANKINIPQFASSVKKPMVSDERKETMEKVSNLVRKYRSNAMYRPNQRFISLFNLIADFYQDFKNSNLQKIDVAKDLDKKLESLYKTALSKNNLETIDKIFNDEPVDRFSLENLQKNHSLTSSITASIINKNPDEFYDLNQDLLKDLEETLGKKVLNTEFERDPTNTKAGQLESLRYFAAKEMRESNSTNNKFLDAMIGKEVSAGKGTYDDIYKNLGKENHEYINNALENEKNLIQELVSDAKKRIINDGVVAISYNSL